MGIPSKRILHSRRNRRESSSSLRSMAWLRFFCSTSSLLVLMQMPIVGDGWEGGQGSSLSSSWILLQQRRENGEQPGGGDDLCAADGQGAVAKEKRAQIMEYGGRDSVFGQTSAGGWRWVEVAARLTLPSVGSNRQTAPVLGALLSRRAQLGRRQGSWGRGYGRSRDRGARAGGRGIVEL